MLRTWSFVIVIRLFWVPLLLIVVACGGMPQGDPARGEQIFSGAVIIRDGDTPACASCHSVTVDQVPTLGMNLSNIGARAERRVEGMSAADYLRESITAPDAVLTGGWQEGIMYRGYAADLTEQQIEDLVAYMLTLRSGEDFGE